MERENLFQVTLPNHMNHHRTLNNHDGMLNRIIDRPEDAQVTNNYYSRVWKLLNSDFSDDEAWLFLVRDIFIDPSWLQSETTNKGTNWTVHEHKLFLSGVNKKGWGNWKVISREIMKTKTAAQIASHAQKYQSRYYSSKEGRRRCSIHDNTTSLEGLQVVPPMNFRSKQRQHAAAAVHPYRF